MAHNSVRLLVDNFAIYRTTDTIMEIDTLQKYIVLLKYLYKWLGISMKNALVAQLINNR